MYTTHYSNPGSLIPVDTATISSARNTLDIAAYNLVDVDICAAILVAANSGASVRLYLDRSELEAEARGTGTLGGKPVSSLLSSPNVEIKVKESSVLMHLKSYLVDGATLRDGSANFSPEGEIQQDNSLTLTDDPTAEDVINSLVSDAATYENAQGFEDWASELGFDADSRRAYRVWEQTEEQTRLLRSFLADEYEAYLYETEGL